MVAGCILEMASSSARNLMICPGLGDQPEKVSGVKPHEEPILAQDQGEEIWHEEEWQYRILPLLEWLQAYQSQTT